MWLRQSARGGVIRCRAHTATILMAEKRSANAHKPGTLAVSFFVSAFFAIAIPISVFAAAYGAGTYGNGLYGSGDDTAPSVSLTGPSDGSTVSGVSVSLSATATDNISVVGVQFKLDGSTNIGAEDTDRKNVV